MYMIQYFTLWKMVCLFVCVHDFELGRRTASTLVFHSCSVARRRLVMSSKVRDKPWKFKVEDTDWWMTLKNLICKKKVFVPFFPIRQPKGSNRGPRGHMTLANPLNNAASRAVWFLCSTEGILIPYHVLCHSSEEGCFITWTQTGHRFVRVSYAKIGLSIADLYCCVMICS
jgi:hypothetical protein